MPSPAARVHRGVLLTVLYVGVTFAHAQELRSIESINQSYLTCVQSAFEQRRHDSGVSSLPQAPWVLPNYSDPAVSWASGFPEGEPMFGIRRRDFITLLGGALADQAIPANAQELRVRTVGVLIGLANDAGAKARTEAFQQGLEREGWSVGHNLRIEYRYAEGDSARMEALTKELVELKPDCVLGQSTPVTAALMRATRTIPIVFVAVSDPIGSGFVASMARPGGNITGFTVLHASIAGKYIEMLKEMVPQLAHVAIMYKPHSAPDAGTFFSRPFIESATKLKVRPITAEVHDASEIENAIVKLGRESGSGLVLVPDNFMAVHRDLIISLTAQFRIPAIYPYRYFAEAGGLVSYGVDAIDQFRRASEYVSRILRGAKPADLPVQAPTKFELVINLRTAKALGLVIPRILLAGAEQVIE
jgi:putative ABC transport system substrate-binding protein